MIELFCPSEFEQRHSQTFSSRLSILEPGNINVEMASVSAVKTNVNLEGDREIARERERENERERERER